MSPDFRAKQEHKFVAVISRRRMRRWFPLKSGGAIILGNTTVPEFLMAWETHSALYGRTNSPWNLGTDAGRAPAVERRQRLRHAVRQEESAVMEADRYACRRISVEFVASSPRLDEFLQPDTFRPSVGPFALLGVVGPMTRTVRDLQLMFRSDRRVRTTAIPMRRQVPLRPGRYRVIA